MHLLLTICVNAEFVPIVIVCNCYDMSGADSGECVQIEDKKGVVGQRESIAGSDWNSG